MLLQEGTVGNPFVRRKSLKYRLPVKLGMNVCCRVQEQLNLYALRSIFTWNLLGLRWIPGLAHLPRLLQNKNDS